MDKRKQYPAQSKKQFLCISKLLYDFLYRRKKESIYPYTRVRVRDNPNLFNIHAHVLSLLLVTSQHNKEFVEVSKVIFIEI